MTNKDIPNDQLSQHEDVSIEKTEPVKKKTTRKKTQTTVLYWNNKILSIVDKCSERNIPVLLMWETGTGKTTLVKSVAEKKKKTLIRINMNGQTGREDFVWKYTLIWWDTVWQDWPLITAMKKWHRMLIDEINVALPEILFVLQAILEVTNGKLSSLLLSEKDWEIIEPHKDFRLFATANPSDWNYVGTKDLNSATLSRFAVIDCQPLKPVQERKLIQDRYPNIHENEIFSIVNMWTELRKAHHNRTLKYFCSTRDLLSVCELIDAGIDKKRAIKSCVYEKVIGKRQKEKVSLIITECMNIKYDDITNILSEVNDLYKIQEEKEETDKKNEALEMRIKEVDIENEELRKKMTNYDDMKKKFDSIMDMYKK